MRVYVCVCVCVDVRVSFCSAKIVIQSLVTNWKMNINIAFRYQALLGSA